MEQGETTKTLFFQCPQLVIFAFDFVGLPIFQFVVLQRNDE